MHLLVFPVENCNMLLTNLAILLCPMCFKSTISLFWYTFGYLSNLTLPASEISAVLLCYFDFHIFYEGCSSCFLVFPCFFFFFNMVTDVSPAGSDGYCL